MEQAIREDLEFSGDTISDVAKQLCGFKIADGIYAISVLDVQEVIRAQRVTPVPLAPNYVKGLINLRGQIVTAISLRTLFGLDTQEKDNYMNIIVRSGESLYSLIVDDILDVIDVDENSFERVPETLCSSIKKFIKGVYKLEKKLMIQMDLQKILEVELKE